MEFLEHLEEWKIQAKDRANSVVAAKVSWIKGYLVCEFSVFPLFWFCITKCKISKTQHDRRTVLITEKNVNVTSPLLGRISI